MISEKHVHVQAEIHPYKTTFYKENNFSYSLFYRALNPCFESVFKTPF